MRLLGICGALALLGTLRLFRTLAALGPLGAFRALVAVVALRARGEIVVARFAACVGRGCRTRLVIRLAQQLGEALARIVGEAAGLVGSAVVGTQQALEGGQIHWCELAFGVFGLPLLSKPEANP